LLKCSDYSCTFYFCILNLLYNFHLRISIDCLVQPKPAMQTLFNKKRREKKRFLIRLRCCLTIKKGQVAKMTTSKIRFMIFILKAIFGSILLTISAFFKWKMFQPQNYSTGFQLIHPIMTFLVSCLFEFFKKEIIFEMENDL